MEEYRQSLILNIRRGNHENFTCTTIERVVKRIENHRKYTINRNEEGIPHSHYLGDRYEPAIIHKTKNTTIHYYLFDGDLKDCEHPFCIVYFGRNRNIYSVTYYSSERIKNGEPIYISCVRSLYNRLFDRILSEYETKSVKENRVKDFSLLCDEMPSGFKFAD